MNEKRQQDIKWLESVGFTAGNNDERFANFYKAVDIFNGSGIKLIFYVEFLDEHYFVEFQIVNGEDELKDWIEAPDVIPNVYVEMADDCSIEQLIGEAEDLAIEKLTENVLNVKKPKEDR